MLLVYQKEELNQPKEENQRRGNPVRLKMKKLPQKKVFLFIRRFVTKYI